MNIRNLSLLFLLLSGVVNAAPYAKAAKILEEAVGIGEKIPIRGAEDILKLNGSSLSTGRQLIEHTLSSGTVDDIVKVTARDSTIAGRFFNPEAVWLLRRNPSAVEDLFPVLVKHDGVFAIKTFSRVTEIYGDTRAVKNALLSVDTPELIQIERALTGKTIDPNILASGIRKVSAANAYKTYGGDLWESACISLADNGRLPKLGLKKGTKLLDGKYNSIHGIDAIGVDSIGRPVIADFTISKTLTAADKPAQMSPEWVANNWNEFIAGSGNAAKLENLGIRKDLIRSVSPEDVERLFSRKFVVPKDGRINGLVYAKLKGTRDYIEVDGR